MQSDSQKQGESKKSELISHNNDHSNSDLEASSSKNEVKKSINLRSN